MAETCHLAAGKNFRACRWPNGSVAISGLGETLNTCEQLRLVHMVPVDPHSPANEFSLMACQDAGQICGQIVMDKPISGVYHLARNVKTVVINTATGAAKLDVDACPAPKSLAVTTGVTLGIGASYEAATLDAVKQLNVPSPTNPDEAQTAEVVEMGYVRGSFIGDHFYVKVRAS